MTNNQRRTFSGITGLIGTAVALYSFSVAYNSYADLNKLRQERAPLNIRQEVASETAYRGLVGLVGTAVAVAGIRSSRSTDKKAEGENNENV